MCASVIKALLNSKSSEQLTDLIGYDAIDITWFREGS